MSEYTKKPWKCTKVINFSGTWVSYIKSATGYQIAQTRIGYDEFTQKEAQEYAELICRAVNSHHDLLEACKAMNRCIEHILKWKEPNQQEFDTLQEGLHFFLPSLKQTIAKATGKE